MSSQFDTVEDYIWGRVDEAGYLQRVVDDESLNSEQLLAKVEAIQRNLNIQLRQGVEENYPRLLQQVSAIELLDSAQASFNDEMCSVAERADELGNIVKSNAKNLREDVIAIENLTKIRRHLVDSIRLI